MPFTLHPYKNNELCIINIDFSIGILWEKPLKSYAKIHGLYDVKTVLKI